MALALRRRQLHRVQGHSMRPTLVEGALVVVCACGTDRVRPGDIVVARHPYRGVHVVKRVAAVGAQGRLWLVGDAGDGSTDSRAFGAVSPERLVGRVTAVLR